MCRWILVAVIFITACGFQSQASPEQAEGRKVDWRSDIFSFGVVLYEMLSGNNPFLRNTLAATLLCTRSVNAMGVPTGR